jgi:hypothetical protein
MVGEIRGFYDNSYRIFCLSRECWVSLEKLVRCRANEAKQRINNT